VNNTIKGLYAIADTALLPPEALTPRVRQALRGGARLVQYRHKSAMDPATLRAARDLRALCRACGVPLLVNDDVALARELDADGVHLGRDDETIAQARAALGPGKIIGASCYNELPLAQEAQAQGADYIAFGSFHDSPTKPAAVNASPTLLTRARRQTDLPLVAIGGITPDNGALLISAGADALAVISGIFAQADPEAAARRYARLFEPASPEDDPQHRD
jgi:thiamine-phosphate pyrophosphorylase